MIDRTGFAWCGARVCGIIQGVPSEIGATGDSVELKVTTFREARDDERALWRQMTPEERLDLVEQLRLRAGEFLYEYPARLRRTVTVVRRQ